MIEFFFSTTLVVLVLSGTGWVLKAEWDRSRCAYLVFEATHAKRTRSLTPRLSTWVRFDEDSELITGERICRNASEKVSLPKLEAARWVD